MQLIRTDELEGAMKELEEREKRSRKISMPTVLRSGGRKTTKK